MAEIVVIAPVLARPQNAQPLADSLARTLGVSCRLLFVCTPNDDPEIQACRKTGADVLVVDWPARRGGDYSRKINEAVRATREPWVLQAADDIRFDPGWAQNALNAAREGVCVVGTNDRGNPRVISGKASTHSLVRRSYIDDPGGAFDEPGNLLHEGYWHNFCDEELVTLARARGVFRFAARSIVEHMHPHWRKAADDATYQRGQKRFMDDSALFRQRSRMWQPNRRRVYTRG